MNSYEMQRLHTVITMRWRSTRRFTQLDERKVFGLAVEFYTAADSLISVLTKLVMQSGTLPGLFARYGDRERKNA